MHRQHPSRQPISNIGRIAVRSIAHAKVTRWIDAPGVINPGCAVECADVGGTALVDGLGQAVAAGGAGGSFTCWLVSILLEENSLRGVEVGNTYGSSG